jgi:hypothetical protein
MAQHLFRTTDQGRKLVYRTTPFESERLSAKQQICLQLRTGGDSDAGLDYKGGSAMYLRRLAIWVSKDTSPELGAPLASEWVQLQITETAALFKELLHERLIEVATDVTEADLADATRDFREMWGEPTLEDLALEAEVAAAAINAP